MIPEDNRFESDPTDALPDDPGLPEGWVAETPDGADRATRDPAYANPRGFYVVTPASYYHPVSRHFTLGEFTMRDGAARSGEDS